MAGDRGLAFVVIGLIGVSALVISNHGHIGPARITVHAAGIDSEPNPVAAAAPGFARLDAAKHAVAAGTPARQTPQNEPFQIFQPDPTALDKELVADPDMSASSAELPSRIR